MKPSFWLAFSCIKGVGSVTMRDFYNKYPYFDFYLLDDIGFMERVESSFKKFLDDDLIEAGINEANRLLKIHDFNGIKVISYESPYYPISLRFIKDPPVVLYAKGNIELLKNMDMVAIVGTREPTDIGLKSAKKIASRFVDMGYVIVSGLALGIDTAGHEGALRKEKGRTIAVMAGDLTKIYPAKNKSLANEILEKEGLLISETPIGKPNTRGSFVQRDRIQSGLSLGICPVQTPIKSGTQHTIRFAKEQERLIFTPTILDIELEENAVQGNLNLIKEGCIELTDPSIYEKVDLKMQLIKHELVKKNEVIKKQKYIQSNDRKMIVQPSFWEI
ncbi:DNA-processing protein DprA [Lysinibacillus sp. UGB7]|uniref:DNA-processing protein DprA n=1 Tax=Lysinibacillus sp. UGB7 TaxID=3411039 RepID=UPI003B824254